MVDSQSLSKEARGTDFLVAAILILNMGLPVWIGYYVCTTAKRGQGIFVSLRQSRMLRFPMLFEAAHRAELADILFSYCHPPLPRDFLIDILSLEQIWADRLLEEVFDG